MMNNRADKEQQIERFTGLFDRSSGLIHNEMKDVRLFFYVAAFEAVDGVFKIVSCCKNSPMLPHDDPCDELCLKYTLFECDSK